MSKLPHKRRPHKRRPLTFRQRDVTRLLRAYDVAGGERPTVRITKDGDLIAIPREPPKDGGAEGNELDKWMSDHARETERA
jgi:hypothetical protein